MVMPFTEIFSGYYQITMNFIMGIFLWIYIHCYFIPDIEASEIKEMYRKAMKGEKKKK